MNCKFELTEQLVQPVLSIRTRTAISNLPQELGKAYRRRRVWPTSFITILDGCA